MLLVFVPALRLAVAASWGSSPLRCTGFSLQWFLLSQSVGSGCTGSVVVAHGEWPSGMGSSRNKDGTCVTCDGRQILNHWTAEVVMFVWSGRSVFRSSAQLQLSFHVGRILGSERGR